jgi:Zn-dependent membrane protease YugP
MTSWQKVHTTSNLYRAEIVRAILEENELNPILVDKRDSTYHFGHYELYVLPEHVLKALKIIQDEIQFE